MSAARNQRRVVQKMRERFWRAFPAEFEDGARRARERNKLYPPGFHSWPLERRNAWWSGFNVGYLDLTRESANG